MASVEHEAELFLHFWAKGQPRASGRARITEVVPDVLLVLSRAKRERPKRIVEAAVIGGLPSLDHVEQFFDAYCTDLERVFKRHFVSADGTSIKKIARLAGHTWNPSS